MVYDEQHDHWLRKTGQLSEYEDFNVKEHQYRWYDEEEIKATERIHFIWGIIAGVLSVSTIVGSILLLGLWLEF